MADILRPDLLWIEGRCYRVHDPCTEINALQEHDLYENEVVYNEMEDDDSEDFEIEMIDKDRYTTSFHVSKFYIGSIIGKKGTTKYRIERDTKTEIKIPRQGQTGDIIIFGSSTSNVKAARRRINIIVMSSRMKQRSTHFISIPMNQPEITKQFEIFKERVLKECSDRNIEESLFIKSNKLHLTLGVMCLMDNEERMWASKLLKEARDNVIMPLLKGHLPLRIRLKGLSYMNDDPSDIDVLYGMVQEEGVSVGVLQKMVDVIVEHFYKAGLMEKEYGRQNVKLHATLLNSKYRNRSSSATDENSSQSRNFRRQRQTFDGSGILEKFGDFDFGVTEISDLHLSQRHSVGSDGYYQSTCVITLSNT